MATSKNRKRRKILVFGTIILLLAALTTAAVLRRREVFVTIQTEKVTRRNITEVVMANGRIQPVLQVKISPEVSGEIIELPVKEGQHVEKGELLVRIKPDFYQASRNSAEASYNGSLANKVTSEANRLRAELDFRRVESLSQNKLVSDSSYLDAKTSYDVAKAQAEAASYQVEMAQASLLKAEEDLKKTTIYSPLSGTVSRLNSQAGERVVGTAMMAGTEIMTIADLDLMEARVDIGEIDIVLIQVGQKARLEVDAFKDRKFTGEVSEIANSSRTGIGTGGGQSQEATRFEVKIRIQEKESFRPGMSVSAEIETRSRTNVLSVPIQCVTTRLPQAKNGKTNAVQNAKSPSTNATQTAQADATNTAPIASGSTNTSKTNLTEKTKASEAPKAIEVVFILEGDRVKMKQVKSGISDSDHIEIIEGTSENDEVVSGSYKAISRDLEDGKRVRKGPALGEAVKDKKPS